MKGPGRWGSIEMVYSNRVAGVGVGVESRERNW
jgi:hypothetical protein